MEKKSAHLNHIRGVANYQFDQNVGTSFFPDEVEISFSHKTGRIRHIYLKKKLLATLRPKDGFFSLTIKGAQQLSSLITPPRFRVVVQKSMEDFAKQGKNVFSRHVISADTEIRPGEEVIVTDERNRVLAVGKALLTGREMLVFKRGVAVKTRRGAGKIEK